MAYRIRKNRKLILNFRHNPKMRVPPTTKATASTRTPRNSNGKRLKMDAKPPSMEKYLRTRKRNFLSKWKAMVRLKLYFIYLWRRGATMKPAYFCLRQEQILYTQVYLSMHQFFRPIYSLLSSTYTVHAQDIYGGTALHRAASWGRPVCVRALLEAGVPVDHPHHPSGDHSGKTPLMNAILHTSSLNPEPYEKCVEILLAAGADKNIRVRGAIVRIEKSSK